MANLICVSNTGDGNFNLAADGWFLDNVKKGDVILYFYVNTRAVIIGRHQNAWKECRLANMADDGVQLVRRHSGGGAVYHDEGNLNFSFIMGERDYDLDRQMNVITSAVQSLGVKCELSGRNDVLIDGKKISGNAYALAKGNRAHHGTLLVNADLSVFPNYLNVSAAKIRSKGIDSVRSRVCNLSEFVPDLSVARMRELVIESFIREYGEAGNLELTEDALRGIERRTEEQRSWEWRFGKTPPFGYVVDHRFPFGEVQIHFSLAGGMIREVRVYSDSLNTSLVPALENALRGLEFTSEAMMDAIWNIDSGLISMAEKEALTAYLAEDGPEHAE